MTVATTNARADYVGSGTTGPFPYTFRILQASDLVVTKRSSLGIETTLSSGTDYTLTGAGSYNGGSVTTTVAVAVGEAISLRRVVSLTQDADLPNQGGYFPDVVEGALDKMAMAIQQQDDAADGALKLQTSETPSTTTTTLPPLADRKGNVLGFDASTGAPIAVQPAGAPVTPAMQPIVASATVKIAADALIASTTIPEASISPVTDGTILGRSAGSAGACQEITVGSGLQLSGGVLSNSLAGIDGNVNYITNGRANTDTTGWATYADAAGTQPVDGTGGAPNVTWTRSTSAPLRGVASFLLTKDAANRQGQGASFAFTIDSADTNKALTIQADLAIASGTYTAGAVTVHVYDVTGAALLPISGSNGIQAGGAFTCQFSSNGNTSYRLIFHVAGTDASAYTLKFDNVSVGPTYAAQGAAMSDWTSYVPTLTGVGTATNVTAEWRRVGAEMEVRGAFTTGTVAGTTFSLTLPQGTIDTLGGTGSDTQIVGAFANNDTTTNPRYVIASPGDTALYANAQALSMSKQNGSTLFSSSVRQSFYAKVKIVGWTANAAVQPGSRYLWAQRFAANATRVTATPARPGEYRARRSGVDTAPTTGPTQGDGFRIDSGSGIAAGRINLYDIYVGPGKVVQLAAYGSTARSGDLDATFYRDANQNGVAFNYDPVTGVATLRVGVTNASDSVGNTVLSFGTVQLGYVDLLIADDPVPLALAPAVHVDATTTSGQTLTTAGVTDVIWSTKNRDTHGAMNSSTGVFTAPITDVYTVVCSYRFAATFAAYPTIYKSGTAIAHGTANSLAATSGMVVAHLYLAAGEQISVREAVASGGSLSTTANHNRITITNGRGS